MNSIVINWKELGSIIIIIIIIAILLASLLSLSPSLSL